MPAPKKTFFALLQQGVVLLDGGLGSQLIAQGLEQGRAPEWWILEHPKRILEVHRQYVEAGSDIIHTNSFGANPLKLQSAGLAGRCEEINRLAVQLAREATAGSSTLVAGDVGPTGKLFPPMGEATAEELERSFLEQVTILAQAGVDLISIETMYDLREALCALAAAKTTGLPVLVSMTFEAKKRGVFTIVGDRLVPTLQTLADQGASAVGLNCSVTSPEMIPMISEARPHVSTPLIAQPNAGQPRPTPDGVVYDAAPEPFAADLLRMVDAGARLLGGCCGTDPSFIRAARRALDSMDGAWKKAPA